MYTRSYNIMQSMPFDVVIVTQRSIIDISVHVRTAQDGGGDDDDDVR